MVVLDRIQMIIPVGAETLIARKRIRKVRSRKDRVRICDIFGLRYGGNSRQNMDFVFSGYSLVINAVTGSVIVMPQRIKKRRNNAAAIDSIPCPKILPMKRVDRVIRREKRPLHGTKQLVIIAARR